VNEEALTHWGKLRQKQTNKQAKYRRKVYFFYFTYIATQKEGWVPVKYFSLKKGSTDENV